MDYENDLPEENQVTEYIERTRRILKPFRIENNNNFYSWLDFFEFVTDMIEVPNEIMVKIFNSMIDEGVHRIVKAFPYPVNLPNLSYDSLTNHYLYYFYRMRPEKINRIRFINRNQYELEPIERYANNLQKLLKKTNIQGVLDKMVYKKFILGLNDLQLRTYIRRNILLSFEETVKKVVSISRALKNYTCECHNVQVINKYRDGNSELFFKWLNQFKYVKDFHKTAKEDMLTEFYELIDINFQAHIKNYYKNVNFSELSYEDTVNYYLSYYKHPMEPNLHKKRFYCRVQFEDESIEGYAERLEKIYDKCDFNDNLKEILSEQFIDGLYKNQIKNYFNRSNHLSFIDILSLAIKCENFAEPINYEAPDLSIIDFYSLKNKDSFYDWLNQFQHKVRNLDLGNLTVSEIFNKKIRYHVRRKVKQANSDIDFSEILYEDMRTLYLRYFASAGETDVYKKLFLCRNQYEKEKITEYADDLYDILSKCNFTGNREQILIDKFINGLYFNEMKIILKRFLSINFHKLIELSKFLEEFNKLKSYLNMGFSRIKIFHPDKGEIFFLWFNKFEYLADIVLFEESKIKKFFKDMVHEDVQELVKKANTDIDFSELRYDQIIQFYLRYYACDDETDLHLKRFLYRNQYEHETIRKYSAILSSIYGKCNISGHPEERLCERFREGLLDENVRFNLSEFNGIKFIVLVAEAIAISNEISNQPLKILLR